MAHMTRHVTKPFSVLRTLNEVLRKVIPTCVQKWDVQSCLTSGLVLVYFHADRITFPMFMQIYTGDDSVAFYAICRPGSQLWGTSSISHGCTLSFSLSPSLSLSLSLPPLSLSQQHSLEGEGWMQGYLKDSGLDDHQLEYVCAQSVRQEDIIFSEITF